jgi:hypothetical protein
VAAIPVPRQGGIKLGDVNGVCSMQERSTQDATVVLLAVMLLNLYSIGAVVRFSQHVGLTLAQSRCPWGCSSSCTWRQPRYSPFRPRASIIRNWAEVHCTGKPLNTEALGCQCFAGQAYFQSHSHVTVLRHCARYMQAGHTGVCVCSLVELWVLWVSPLLPLDGGQRDALI